METFFGHPIHELMAITFIATDLVALKVEFAEQSKELTNRCMVSRDLQGSSTIGARLPSQMAIMFNSRPAANSAVGSMIGNPLTLFLEFKTKLSSVITPPPLSKARYLNASMLILRQ
jgi:hypothetical protein